jgi:hypothetical protein
MNFKTLMVSTLLVLSASIHAQDHIGWGDIPGQPGQQPGGRPNQPNRPHQPTPPTQPSRPTQPTQPLPGRDPWGNSPGQGQGQNGNGRNDIRDVEIQIAQYYQGQARLNLLQDSYIRSQLQGNRIKEIIITASTEQGNGQARLLVNGQSLDQGQFVARQMASYTFKVDPFSNSVDQSLRSLELEMKGRFYVEKAVFVLIQDNGPSYPGPGIPSQPQVEVVRQQLNESISGEGGLQLYRLFNLAAERQGQALRRVIVLARSQRGSAQGQLLVNDQNSASAQNIGMSSTRLTFEVSGQRIGREIQGLRLYFRGNVIVEEVSLEFDRSGSFPGQGQGPIQEQRIEQVINQRVYDTNGVNLTALMRIERRHEERIVESVELYLRNSDYGANLKLCQQVQGPYATLNCGNITTLSPGAQVVRLTSVNFAKLSELSLSVRMGMIDIDRIVINLR